MRKFTAKKVRKCLEPPSAEIWDSFGDSSATQNHFDLQVYQRQLSKEGLQSLVNNASSDAAGTGELEQSVMLDKLEC